MNSKNIAVFISGGGSNFKSILDNLDSINGEVVIVVSNIDAAGLSHGEEKDIPTLISKDFYEIDSKMEELDIDLIVLAGYLEIIPEWFTDKYTNKIINIHPSLLPSFGGPGFYGKHVHKAVLDKGVRYSGATTHFVNEIPDDGPIILQAVVDVFQDDTPESLAARVLIEEHKIIAETVRLFCDDRLKVLNNKVIIE